MIINDLKECWRSLTISSQEFSSTFVAWLKFNECAKVLIHKQFSSSLQAYQNLSVSHHTQPCYLVLTHMIFLRLKTVLWWEFNYIPVWRTSQDSKVLFTKMIKGNMSEVTQFLIFVLVAKFEGLFRSILQRIDIQALIITNTDHIVVEVQTWEIHVHNSSFVIRKDIVFY